jgi:hypothetical protein
MAYRNVNTVFEDITRIRRENPGALLGSRSALGLRRRALPDAETEFESPNSSSTASRSAGKRSQLHPR